MTTTAIILAGGTGKRLQGPEPKQFRKIGGKTLLDMCLKRFQGQKGISGMVLVCPKAHLQRARRIAGKYPKITAVLAGGRTRQLSSAIGVAAAGKTGRILIHDAARALVSEAVIDRVLNALARQAAVMPVVVTEDTTVRVDVKGRVNAVLDRDKLRRVQTPQGFRADIIRIAHKLARDEGISDAPDDCSLVLRYGLAPVATVNGDVANIKVTVAPDLIVAESILARIKKR
ncbi:MAG: 2-C-methyl-D-erythritol 4-phosphate cytidylyltransferase [Candidatus Aminicenantes bacterium]|nr:2-C-methyl-D-erythritol 4-phosphate cytidylyltransferase [Candidatus Aminicenantes bacterium]